MGRVGVEEVIGSMNTGLSLGVREGSLEEETSELEHDGNKSWDSYPGWCDSVD